MRKSVGFTLLETMVVVAIIGILATMAVPGLISLTRRTKVSSEAGTMGALFNSMRAQAVTRGFPTVACIRGRNYVPSVATDFANSTVVYRKAEPLLSPNLPTVLTAGLEKVTPPLDLVLDTHIKDEAVDIVFPTLPVALDESKTLQFVFDMNGAVTVFIGDHCDSTANGSRAPVTSSSGLEFTVQNRGDTNISQKLQLRRDGTVALP